nr:protein N-terminal and lysine N-methyltransferase EFM7-like isoform X2 [Coffea arabica]
MDIALFSPASLFADPDGDSNDEETKESHQNFVERKHQFPGMELIIREFSFHQLNANLLWPGTFAFAEWLVQNRSWMVGRRVIELGSGTGALAIFLHKSFNLNITTSDYDDPDIEDNIAHNCRFNGIIPVLPHIKHVKQYPNLIKTLSFLLKSYKPQASEEVSQKSQSNDACLLPRPAFLMSWRRRIRKEDESLFFNGCDEAGLEVQHLGTRVYCIVPREVNC